MNPPSFYYVGCSGSRKLPVQRNRKSHFGLRETICPDPHILFSCTCKCKNEEERKEAEAEEKFPVVPRSPEASMDMLPASIFIKRTWMRRPLRAKTMPWASYPRPSLNLQNNPGADNKFSIHVGDKEETWLSADLCPSL